jgi:hypothetical protein
MTCTCQQQESLDSKIERFMKAQPSRSNGRVLYYLAKEIITEIQTNRPGGQTP